MKKLIDLYIGCEADVQFAESSLQAIQPVLEGLGLNVTRLGVHMDLQLMDVPAGPCTWQTQAVQDAAAGKGIDAQTVLSNMDELPKDGPWAATSEEPKPAEAPAHAKDTSQGGLVDRATLKKALYAVKDKLGTEALQALYKAAAGGVTALKDVKPEDYAGLYSAAQEALNAAD